MERETMFVGIRDVMTTKVEIDAPWAWLGRRGVSAVEVRVAPDLSLDAFRPEGESLAVGDEEACRRVLEAAERVGVRIGGILLNTQYEEESFAAADHARWVDAAAQLARLAGLEVVRIDVRPKLEDGRPTLEWDPFLALAAPKLETDLAAAGEHGIGLAVENHAHFTNQPDRLGALLDRFGTKGLSLTLDTGNFYCTGGCPLSALYGIIERFAGRVTHVHVKNVSYPADAREVQGHRDIPYHDARCPIPEGDVDHARVVRILRDAGYRGGLYIEDESLNMFPPPRRTENLSRAIEYLRDLVESLDA